MIVVNLFGAPGAGKSTGAAYIFYRLKELGYNAELVTEFAKDKVWEESKEVFKNQAYIFGKQSFRLSRLKDKVDVVITDSPILLSVFYNKDPVLGENFNNTVLDVFNSYNNVNYYIKRVKEYNPKGRFQTEEESDVIGCVELPKFLKSMNVETEEIFGNIDGYNKIVDDLINRM